jgi:hypothetical protein
LRCLTQYACLVAVRSASIRANAEHSMPYRKLGKRFSAPRQERRRGAGLAGEQWRVILLLNPMESDNFLSFI